MRCRLAILLCATAACGDPSAAAYEGDYEGEETLVTTGCDASSERERDKRYSVVAENGTTLTIDGVCPWEFNEEKRASKQATYTLVPTSCVDDGTAWTFTGGSLTAVTESTFVTTLSFELTGSFEGPGFLPSCNAGTFTWRFDGRMVGKRQSDGDICSKGSACPNDSRQDELEDECRRDVADAECGDVNEDYYRCVYDAQVCDDLGRTDGTATSQSRAARCGSEMNNVLACQRGDAGPW